MKNERTRILVALLCSAGAPLACSDGGAVNIGNTTSLGAQLSDYAATWDGYAEATTFSDGSDHVHLTIDASGQGFLVVGDSAPLPAPTDPTVGYPPGAGNEFQTGSINPPFPGFPYPLHAAAVDSDRIQVGIDLNDAYSAWCAIEPPVAVTTNPNGGDGGYGCAPSFTKIDHPNPDGSCTLYAADGTIETADCGWLTLCWLGPVCTCTATACSATLTPDGMPVTQYPGELDGALDSTGTTLTATFRLGTGAGGVTVVLKKK